MDWDLLIHAVDGKPAALARLAEAKWSHDAAVGAALLLLEETPHAAAALVVAGSAAPIVHVRPVAAALAPHAAPALAAWRADPDWAARCIGARVRTHIIRRTASLGAALLDAPAVLDDAVAIVAHSGDDSAIDGCLVALGAAGWRALDDAPRAALWTRALRERPAALGSVWSALSDAQREDAACRAAADGWMSSDLIGRIGAAAWDATADALRERLVAAAARRPSAIYCSAPAWSGMSDEERGRLTTAVAAHDDPWSAYRLLRALGVDGRRALSPAQRNALERQATKYDDVWGAALLRVGDAGWDGVSDADRRALVESAAEGPMSAAALIRAVGIGGWNALPSDVQATMRASVRRSMDALFDCPPALWVDISGGRSPPPATTAPAGPCAQWNASDVAADLSELSPSHQALVFALTPWSVDDLAPHSPRMARLLAAWDGMTPNERTDLAMAHPWALAVVTAAARLDASAPAIAKTSNRATSVVADALSGIAQHAGGDGKRAIGDSLARSGGWRSWMRAFAPTDDDSLGEWEAWRRAAQRGAIRDRGIVLRLMAHGARIANRGRRRGREGG